MAKPPTSEFGKRRPVVPPTGANPVTPVKRSGHVALLLMGTVAVGGGTYAMAVRNNCEPAPPGMAAPATPGMVPSPQAATSCSSRGYSSGGSGGSWSRRSSFFDAGSSSSSSGTGSGSGSASVSRGGFGSFAHAFAGHFGGG